MNGEVCRLQGHPRAVHGHGPRLARPTRSSSRARSASSSPASPPTAARSSRKRPASRSTRRAGARPQLKLEAAQQNLLRVNDIVHEVEKQLESLKRQASKARRYRALREEMQGVERVLFGRRFLDLQAQAAHARGAPRRRRRARSRRRHRPRDRRGADGGAPRRPLRGRRRGSRRCARALERADRSPWTATRAAAATARSRSRRRRRAAAAARTEGGRARGARRPAGRSNSTARRARGAALRDELAAAEGHRRRRRGRRCASGARGSRAARRASRRPRATRRSGLVERIGALQNARASVSGSAERAAADLLKLAAEIEELEPRAARASTALRADAAARASRRAEARLEATVGRARAPRSRAASALRHGRGGGRAARPASLQSERDGLAGRRRRSLEEMVATPRRLRRGRARAARPSPEGIEVLRRGGRLRGDRLRPRARGGGLPRRLACRPCWCPTPRRALRGIALPARVGRRARRAPAARVRAPQHGATAARLRDVAAEEPRVRGLLSDLLPRQRALTPTPSAPRCPRRSWSTRSRTRSSSSPAAARCLRDPRPARPCAAPMVEGGRARARACLSPRREIKEVEEHARASSTSCSSRGARARDGARGGAAAADGESRAASRSGSTTPRRTWSPSATTCRLPRKSAPASTARRRSSTPSAARPRTSAARRRCGWPRSSRLSPRPSTDRARGRRAARRPWRCAWLESRAAAGSGPGASPPRCAAAWPPCASAPAPPRRSAAAARSRAPRAGRAPRGRTAARGGDGRARPASSRAELRGHRSGCSPRPSSTATALTRRGRRAPRTAVRETRNELESARSGAQGAPPRARDAARRPLGAGGRARRATTRTCDHLARECHQAVGQTAAECAADAHRRGPRARARATSRRGCEEMREPHRDAWAP